MQESTSPFQPAFDFSPIPLGFCQCGCGRETRLAPQSSAEKGWINGQPLLYCKGHHFRYRTGEDVAQFWSKVAQPEHGCWPFQGATDNHGYGSVAWHGKRVKAHRLAWILTNGPIPPGKWVLHRCDNPPCCRQGDLFLGTAQENTDDMHAKGRWVQPRVPRGEYHFSARHPEAIARGELSSAAKITEIVARQILNASGGDTHIARALGVSRGIVKEIRKGRSWKHLTPQP